MVGWFLNCFLKGSIKSQIGQTEIFGNWRWMPVFSIRGTFSIRRKGLQLISTLFWFQSCIFLSLFCHTLSLEFHCCWSWLVCHPLRNLAEDAEGLGAASMMRPCFHIHGHLHRNRELRKITLIKHTHKHSHKCIIYIYSHITILYLYIWYAHDSFIDIPPWQCTHRGLRADMSLLLLCVFSPVSALWRRSPQRQGWLGHRRIVSPWCFSLLI